MKLIYFIYFHDPDNLSAEPQFYAITDKKSIMIEFKNQRNMKYFVIKEKEVKKEDAKKLINDHVKYVLKNQPFHTHYEGMQYIIYFITTEHEFMHVFTSADTLFFDLSKYTSVEAFRFNKKILSALNDLYYFNAMKMQYDKSIALPFIDFNSIPPFLDGVETMNVSDFKIDEFGIYMHLYGKTVSNKFKGGE